MSAYHEKVALITGGSRGIGLGIALELAGGGFSVAINGVRDPSEIAPVLDELKSAGADAMYVQADVADLSHHQKMLGEIRNRFGRLDVLINNAGVAAQPRADILDATPESFDRLISINLRGPYFLTQAAARWMVEQRQRRSRLPRVHRERVEHQRDCRVGQSRRLLHQQSRHYHGHPIVGCAPCRIRN